MEIFQSNNKRERSTCNEDFEKNFETHSVKPHLNVELHRLGLDIKEVDKLFAIISQSDLEALNKIANNKLKTLKPNERFAPYPIHRQLFMRQQHEQERRRQSMIISSRLPTTSKGLYENLLRTSSETISIRNEIVHKIITFIDTYSVRMYSKQYDCNDKCVVCMYNYRENEQLRKLQCNHKFHRKCVDEWLVKSYLCPVCRTELLGSGTINTNVSVVYRNSNSTLANGSIFDVLSLPLREPAVSSGMLNNSSKN